MEYYSAINKNKTMPCSNMDVPRDYHNKCNDSERERQIYNITYIWNPQKRYK